MLELELVCPTGVPLLLSVDGAALGAVLLVSFMDCRLALVVDSSASWASLAKDELDDDVDETDRDAEEGWVLADRDRPDLGRDPACEIIGMLRPDGVGW